MTEEQLEANRRNALKSTGPRTSEGKAASKMNAVKHGVLAKSAVVQGLEVQENREAFAEFHEEYLAELKPVGPLEEMLVEQIVMAHWRLRRAMAAEAGEIALNAHEAKRERVISPVMQMKLWMHAAADPVWSMQQTLVGSRLLEGWLRELRTEVIRDGGLTEEAVQRFTGRFLGKPNFLTLEMDHLRAAWETRREGREESAWREEKRKEALAVVSWHLAAITREAEARAVEEDSAGEARRQASSLPAMATLEKIGRYETKLQKQLYQAIKQLERVQERRKGQLKIENEIFKMGAVEGERPVEVGVVNEGIEATNS